MEKSLENEMETEINRKALTLHRVRQELHAADWLQSTYIHLSVQFTLDQGSRELRVQIEGLMVLGLAFGRIVS